ncbi:amidase family protein [Streptomyces sp. AC495_CC817]|uniref:amidase family protein n=1 Tax=Streptomyces sp. AC495_CC817 TaxID=2823900 RepID=UPI001C263F4E|nr:amidase family protein [Streptomyces sp. AC495_CC817]
MRTPGKSGLAGAAALAVAACLTTTLSACAPERVEEPTATELATFLDGTTIPDLQTAMDSDEVTAEQLTAGYLQRIEELDPRLEAVVQTNPDALALARESDERRADSRPRGPLEGIPVLLKENIDTHDSQTTTAGSTALSESRPAADAVVVERLRDAGAIVLGKTNMTEWANFYSSTQVPGWSAFGGQTRNAYDQDRSPCGSSSGSAVAAAAALAVVTIGTDTGGSITCPATAASTVGVKPTLGLVSRTGIVPITHRQDMPGPIARTVEDAVVTLSVIAGPDPADPATQSTEAHPFTVDEVLDATALDGARVGVWREGHESIDAEADRLFDAAVAELERQGATVVEGADVADIGDLVMPHLYPALLTEFRHDLNRYLAATPGEHPQTLTELIAYNEEHADVELPGLEQDILLLADQTDGDLDGAEYRQHRGIATAQAQASIDDVLQEHDLDAIVTLTDLPSGPLLDNEPRGFRDSARSTSIGGYPHVTVPAGYTDAGLPVGLSFIGTGLSDTDLLGYAYAYEQATELRRAPKY